MLFLQNSNVEVVRMRGWDGVLFFYGDDFWGGILGHGCAPGATLRGPPDSRRSFLIIKKGVDIVENIPHIQAMANLQLTNIVLTIRRLRRRRTGILHICEGQAM
ncbi:MAG: hypothetical protein EA364_13970 [Balneolaceae bacterium]|nr:MAG: hypothetical protein EA364_13970 [Balneolaceae bacterium]